jgi:RimJ/RimL family protein N-acetyltransferase
MTIGEGPVVFTLVTGSDDELRFLLDIRNDSRQYYIDSDPIEWESQKIWWAKASKSPENRYLIVWRDQTRIGVARQHLLESDPVGLGGDILKQFRGQGLGRELFLALIELTSVEFSPPKIWLDVLETNERAYGLYDDLGFIEVSRSNGIIRMTLQDSRY